MTDQEWQAIALLLDKGWKGKFGPGEDRAYRTLLDGYTVEELTAALRRLLAKGSQFIPSVSEIVQAVGRDADRPTFIEAFSALYDSRPACGGRGVFWTPASERPARAWGIHPLLGAFVDSYGLERLAMLEVDHPDHGRAIRRDLERVWNGFVEANEHRDAAALAAGRRREVSGELRRADPFAAISQPREEGEQ